MFIMLAVLVYLSAIAVPVYLLYRFGSEAWYWHLLSIAAAIAVGLVPTPPQWKSAGVDLLFGFVLTFLLLWGVGGLVVFRPHIHTRAKHA